MRTLIALIVFASTVPAGDYIWPTSASTQVSGTFAERRETHYHAGIDIRTHRTTGFPVYAVADGEVYRLYCSPWGYGRGVYFQTDDGLRCVYAHLSAFNDTLGAIVSTAQKNARRYRVDLRFESGERVRFSQGDVLGYTGATGAGPPHLHFETRDGNDRPVNALTTGFGGFVLDTEPPRLDRLGVRPMTPNATINGRSEAVGFPLDEPLPPLHLWGPVAFSLVAHDVTDSTMDAWMGLYGWELEIDGVLRASTRYERFSYATNWRIHIDRDRGWVAEGWWPPYALWCQSGNTNPRMTRSKPGDGAFDWGADLAPGPHRVVIRAVDAHGNTDSLAFVAHANEAPRVERCELASNTLILAWNDPDGESATVFVEKLTETFEAGLFLLDTVLIQEVPARGMIEAPMGEAVGGYVRVRVVDESGGVGEAMLSPESDSVSTLMLPVRTGLSCRVEGSSSSYTARVSVGGSMVASSPLVPRWDTVEKRVVASTVLPWPSRNGVASAEIVDEAGESVHAETIALRWVDAGRYAVVSSSDEAATLSIPSGAALEHLPITISEIPFDAPDSIIFASPVYHFGPIWSAFADRATVSISKTNPDVRLSKTAVFRFDPLKRKWEYEGMSHQGGATSAKTRILGTFALIEDDDPPVLRNLQPADGDTVSGEGLQVRAVVYDLWSGISSDRHISVVLDGVSVIAEYEIDEGYVFYDVPQTLGHGSHTLRVSARDRLGNRTSAGSTFYVR